MRVTEAEEDHVAEKSLWWASEWKVYLRWEKGGSFVPGFNSVREKEK